MKKEERIIELEQKAKDKYIENIEWVFVIDCLSEDEQKEYYTLMLQVNPLSKLAKEKLRKLVR